MKISKLYFYYPFFFFLFLSTGIKIIEAQTEQIAKEPLLQFSLLPASHTNIAFNNLLVENDDLNILTYQYLYNGGGVAVGDINNDGLPDIYFTGNQVGDKLYVNKGNFIFEDITAQSKIDKYPGWSTGVTMADINADGLLDIYVCRSGKNETETRRNKLFINNGDLTFTEDANRYHLDDAAYSTMAAFFDYDLDGDLDMFLLNHSVTQYKNFIVDDLRKQRDPLAGDKLYRNDNGYYTDVSEIAGIKGNPINFGLGVSVGDMNNDGFPDILCTNDYQEQDYLYLNNKNGTFSEILAYAVGHTSNFSMGCDIADFNNDGFQDFITLDMLSEDNYRQKILKGPQKYDAYQLAVDYGFFHQVMKNALQLNNMNGTFSDISALAGVSNTDWSWSPLFADFDNDGFLDLHITNGYRRDFTDMDFIKYTYADEMEKARRENRTLQLMDVVNKMPSIKLPDYIFHNTGNLTFEDKTKDWGLFLPSFSQGAAYADLDNDGDLDIIVNNMNDAAFIYRNNAEMINKKNYLKIKLEGEGKNTFAIGSKVTITAGSKKFIRENFPVRGYQSSVDYTLQFGLDTIRFVDVLIEYPGGKSELRKHVATDQTLLFKQSNAKENKITYPEEKQIFNSFQQSVKLPYQHTENKYIDFKREPLLPHQLSQEGPSLDTADVNNDDLTDVFICGTTKNPGRIFFQNTSGNFSEDTAQYFASAADQTSCAFFDCDKDGDQDLYIACGGNEFEQSAYRHTLYVNDGKGKFTLSANLLPEITMSSTCVRIADFDKDGDDDIFIGGNLIPGKYPLSPNSILLQNENGKFIDVSAKYFENADPGMVTDAAWADVNKDGYLDLIVVGEWMPVTIYINQKNTFVALQNTTLQNNSGWWNCITPADIDKDGDIDFIAGNRGLNSQIKASVVKPTTIYANDFDKNGTIDPIINYYIGDTSYPLASRDELLDQINMLKKKYVHYSDYASATMQTIFPNIDPDTIPKLSATQFATCYIENIDGNNFIFHPLPIEAQFAPVNSVLVSDFNGDNNADILLGGNDYTVRPELGRMDAGQGLLLTGDGRGNFTALNFLKSGVYLPGQVADMKMIDIQNEKFIIVVKDNAPVQVIELNK